MFRTDLLILELMQYVAEGYRHRYRELARPPCNGSCPVLNDDTPHERTDFHNLVSGRTPRGVATLLGCGLRAAEVPYTWAVPLAQPPLRPQPAPPARRRTGGQRRQPDPRRHRQDAAGRVACPVVLAARRPVCVISRGYGARAGGPNDEARELAWKLPGVPHLQKPDRVAAAARAIVSFGCRAIVLDDAFQHRRIARDLDIVLLDALEPFGFGHVFRGARSASRLAGLARADSVALSRADLLPPPTSGEAIRRQVGAAWPPRPHGSSAHAPEALLAWPSRAGESAPLAACRPPGRGILRHRQSRGLSPHAGGMRLRGGRVLRVS